MMTSSPGFFSSTNPVLYFIAIVVVIIIFIRPYWGLAILLGLIPMNNLFPSEGLLGSVYKLFGLVVLLASLFNIIKRIDRVVNNKESYIYLSLVLWSFLSILWSQNAEACISKDFTYFQLFLLYVIIITSTDRQNYPFLLKGFVIGAMLSLMTIPFANRVQEGFSERAAGGGMDMNEYASTIAIAIVLALTWILFEKGLWKKILPLVFIPLGLLGIAYTKSRTGTFALLPVSIYLFKLFKNKGAGVKLLSIFIIMTSFLTIFYLMPEGYVQRVTEINKRSGHRLYVWTVGLKIIADNFLLGVGSSNFTVAFPKYGGALYSEGIVAHNSFISIFGELGIVGIILFLWLFYCHLKDLVVFIRTNQVDDRNKIIAKGLLYALMTFMTASIALSWEYNKLLPFLLGSIWLLTKTDGILNTRL